MIDLAELTSTLGDLEKKYEEAYVLYKQSFTTYQRDAYIELIFEDGLLRVRETFPVRFEGDDEEIMYKSISSFDLELCSLDIFDRWRSDQEKFYIEQLREEAEKAKIREANQKIKDEEEFERLKQKLKK